MTRPITQQVQPGPETAAWLADIHSLPMAPKHRGGLSRGCFNAWLISAPFWGMAGYVAVRWWVS